MLAVLAFGCLSFLSTEVLADEADLDSGDLSSEYYDAPLQLSDIMPQNRKHYDKMRPPKYKANATEVVFHVTVMSLDTIDESSMTYTCDVFFAQSWKDDRLKWRKDDNITAKYRMLPIEWLTEIWRPDSFFKNAKSVTFQTMTIPNHYIWLWKDKTILYMVKLTLVLSCPMHFKNYPHDTQTCRMQIESISHTTEELVFIWDPSIPLDVDKGIELPQLELISTTNEDCTTEYSTGTFTCLEVVFIFKRRLGYYLFHTYVPTCLIVIMSWISFWIKPEAVPARVTLGVTSLLTLSTQHANSQKSLPPVSYIKAIDVFMSGCTFFVFLSLMEYALVNIVMGDIADIEKKKSMGISNLILGTRGIPIKRNDKDIAIENEDIFHYGNHDNARTGGGAGSGTTHRDHSYTNLFSGTSMNPVGAAAMVATSAGASINSPLSTTASQYPSNSKCSHTHSQATTQNISGPSFSHHHDHQRPFEDSAHQHHITAAVNTGIMPESSEMPTAHSGGDGTGDTAVSGGLGLRSNVIAGGSNGNGGGNNVITAQLGIKNLVHDVQLKRQKEIRDMMKKKREKAVLVDRISRWLFPTSFILLNIVYWALFGDHELW